MAQPRILSFIFEQVYTRDLRTYSVSHDSCLSYYRDRYGLETDLVLHPGDGRYAPIKHKLGSREIEEGAKHLLEIKQLVHGHNKTEKQVSLREPDLMIVMTGGGMTYTHSDGVKVISLAYLKDQDTHVLNWDPTVDASSRKGLKNLLRPPKWHLKWISVMIGPCNGLCRKKCNRSFLDSVSCQSKLLIGVGLNDDMITAFMLFFIKGDLCKTFSSFHKFTYNHIKSRIKPI